MGDSQRWMFSRSLLEDLLEESRGKDAVHLAPLECERRRGEAGDAMLCTGYSELTFTAKLETVYRPMRRAVDDAHEALEEGAGETASGVGGCFVSYDGSRGALEPAVAHLHLSLFNRPGQIALIADPGTAEFGLYRRDSNGHFVNERFDIFEETEAPGSDDD